MRPPAVQAGKAFSEPSEAKEMKRKQEDCSWWWFPEKVVLSWRPLLAQRASFCEKGESTPSGRTAWQSWIQSYELHPFLGPGTLGECTPCTTIQGSHTQALLISAEGDESSHRPLASEQRKPVLQVPGGAHMGQRGGSDARWGWGGPWKEVEPDRRSRG